MSGHGTGRHARNNTGEKRTGGNYAGKYNARKYNAGKYNAAKYNEEKTVAGQHDTRESKHDTGTSELKMTCPAIHTGRHTASQLHKRSVKPSDVQANSPHPTRWNTNLTRKHLTGAPPDLRNLFRLLNNQGQNLTTEKT
jgi:hypothetical protein